MNYSLDVDRLIDCRKKLGITKTEAAKRMQLSQPAYLRYESGDRTPSIQTLHTIANVLETSVEYLIGKVDNPSPSSYTIFKSNNPEMFELIKLCKNLNNTAQNRLLAYAKGLTINKP